MLYLPSRVVVPLLVGVPVIVVVIVVVVGAATAAAAGLGAGAGGGAAAVKETLGGSSARSLPTSCYISVLQMLPRAQWLRQQYIFAAEARVHGTQLFQFYFQGSWSAVEVK